MISYALRMTSSPSFSRKRTLSPILMRNFSLTGWGIEVCPCVETFPIPRIFSMLLQLSSNSYIPYCRKDRN